VAGVPRYFFHIGDCERLITDDEGLELIDTAEAKQQAMRAIGEMVRDGTAKACSGVITVEVFDTSGTLRFRAKASFSGELA
jgi:hypothetical protein